MNTKNRSTKIVAVLSSLILVMVGLVGCGALEIGAVQVEAENGSAGENGAQGTRAIEIGIEPTPTPAKRSYTNDFYGFKFDYPETWTLTEENHRVVLKKGTNRLGINYRWINENIHSGRSGVGAGDFIYGGKIQFMDQIIPGEVLLYEKRSKAVFYGETGWIEIGDLVFGIVLEDLETDYMVLDLPEDVIVEANVILESFEQIAATGSNPVAVPTQEPSPPAPEVIVRDMSVYENRVYGFTFRYPSHMSVVEEPNQVLVNHGTLQLMIAYRGIGEFIQISEIGELTGQFHPYIEVPFLGSPVQAVLNIHDGLITAAYLGGPGVELGEGTPLRFAVSLVNLDGDRISNAQVDEMLQIFQSFELASWSE